MSHSEVTMFSRCQGRFFCNLFSAVDCLSFLLHPPSLPPILAVVFIPVINVVCGVTPSRSFLPSSSLHFCVSFSLCFFFHLLLPVLLRSSHMGHGHLQTRHHDHLTQQTHRGGGQLLQGQRTACQSFIHNFIVNKNQVVFPHK